MVLLYVTFLFVLPYIPCHGAWIFLPFSKIGLGKSPSDLGLTADPPRIDGKGAKLIKPKLKLKEQYFFFRDLREVEKQIQ